MPMVWPLPAFATSSAVTLYIHFVFYCPAFRATCGSQNVPGSCPRLHLCSVPLTWDACPSRPPGALTGFTLAERSVPSHPAPVFPEASSVSMGSGDGRPGFASTHSTSDRHPLEPPWHFEQSSSSTRISPS